MSGGVCSNLIQPTGIGGGETGKMSVNEGLMFSVLVLFLVKLSFEIENWREKEIAKQMQIVVQKFCSNCTM